MVKKLKYTQNVLNYLEN